MNCQFLSRRRTLFDKAVPFMNSCLISSWVGVLKAALRAPHDVDVELAYREEL